MQAGKQATIVGTRQHFIILDGMRGIAALAVVTFHFMEIAYSDYSQNFIAHGFLAVDFFFCLSGFVMGYAYDGRMQQLGIWQFVKRRLVRLHPLVVLGTALGLLALYFHPFSNQPVLHSTGEILLLVACGIFMVPQPTMPDRFFNLFGLNAPAWSLFWEYVASLMYGFILWRINRRWLAILLLSAAIGICLVAWRAGNLLGGWGGSTFWDGGARVAYSFIAGMVVYRYNIIIKNKLGFIGMGVLLMLALLTPFGQYNWLTEPFIVLLYFPLLLALGAGTAPGAKLQKICAFSGNISYPLYMTHYCVMWAFGSYYASHRVSTGQLALIIIVGLIVLTFFAWVVMVGYDVPVRKWLGKRGSLGKGK